MYFHALHQLIDIAIATAMLVVIVFTLIILISAGLGGGRES
jgi:hypothetical protein